jgi:hypothetical protein
MGGSQVEADVEEKGKNETAIRQATEIASGGSNACENPLSSIFPYHAL